MNATGLVSKILDKVKEAQTPDRFTLDFLGTKLGFTGGSASPFIPLAKRLGLLNSDGTPSELYKQFRNHETSGAAIAQAVKNGYSELYLRNEFAHELDRNALEGLIVEATGLEKGHKTLRAIAATFEALKKFADFEAKLGQKHDQAIPPPQTIPASPSGEETKLNLSYTINLVLPKTDDISVFNAIFQSLREHLLRK